MNLLRETSTDRRDLSVHLKSRKNRFTKCPYSQELLSSLDGANFFIPNTAALVKASCFLLSDSVPSSHSPSATNRTSWSYDDARSLLYHHLSLLPSASPVLNLLIVSVQTVIVSNPSPPG